MINIPQKYSRPQHLVVPDLSKDGEGGREDLLLLQRWLTGQAQGLLLQDIEPTMIYLNIIRRTLARLPEN